MLNAGLYNPDWAYAGGGEKVAAVIAQRLAAAGWNVTLYGSGPIDVPRLQRVLNVDLSACDTAIARSPFAPLARGAARFSHRAARFIDGRTQFSFARGLDLLVHITGSIPPACPARAGLLFVQFPYDEAESIRVDGSGHPERPTDREKIARLGSWPVKVCPSAFVQSWTEKRWLVRPDVLNPPAEIGHCRPRDKERIILTVGRFYATGPTKKHAVMVRAFREMCDAGLDGWRLVVAGGTHPREDHQQYVQEVRSLAEGYPVEVLTDLTFGQVLPLYGKASIYWHATGAGEDESVQPGLFEQFGMTIVEAMASGCVPVVINGGGIRDIVRDGTDGFLWRTTDELKSRTLDLIGDPSRRWAFQEAAVARAGLFSREAFEQRVDSLIAGIEARLAVR